MGCMSACGVWAWLASALPALHVRILHSPLKSHYVCLLLVLVHPYHRAHIFSTKNSARLVGGQITYPSMFFQLLVSPVECTGEPISS